MATEGSHKREMRARVRAARQQMGPGQRAAASAQVRAHLAGLGELAHARAVLAYTATGAEVDLDPLLSELCGRGTSLYLPVVEADDLVAARITDLEHDLVAGYRGVREPRPGLRHEPAPPVDVALVPGLAFDRSGGRLGHGGGHFDRLLGRLREATRVGVAFTVQVVDAVPTEAHDQRIDMLATEEGILRVLR